MPTFVVISKCEKCGSPIFSESFDQQVKAFTDTKVTRSCDCYESTWILEGGEQDGESEEADQTGEAGQA